MNKRILCYGDSNTWGYNPSDPKGVVGVAGRYPDHIRWTGVMNDLLKNCKILEAGLVGRTTVFHDPLLPGRNGMEALEGVLLMTDPLDLIILMLGTNDTKDRFCVQAEEISRGLERLIQKIKEVTAVSSGSQLAKVLIVSPPYVSPGDDGKYYWGFSEKSREKSMELAECYLSVAQRNGCAFFDGAQAAPSRGKDGVHLTPESHRTLGEGLLKTVRCLLSTPQ